MKKRNITLVFFLTIFSLSINAQNYKQGLVGIYYNSRTFVEPDRSIDIIPGLNIEWQKSRGSDWSAKWHGFIEAPYTGKVKFRVDVKDSFLMYINGMTIIDGLDESGSREGEFNMTKGLKYPVEIEYISIYGQAKIHLYWQYGNTKLEIVPDDAFSYDADKLPKNYRVFNYNERLKDGDKIDTAFITELPHFSGSNPPYANTDYHDGRFRPAVGVHNFKIVRANRSYPELVTEKVPDYPEAGFVNTGFTYNHQPHICYWQGKFWMFYQSAPVNEHQPPCYGLITWSEDGRNWAKPQTIFPAKKFNNRKKDNEEQYSILHERMGFYVSPSGKLLVIGYYGLKDAPNDGKGVGRAIREINGTGNYGPIYWVRYGKYQGYNKDNSPYFPYYKDSKDEKFVESVDSLLANKLMVQQWFEEDQDTTDSFFAYKDRNVRFLKAFDWYTLPDSRIVGMWKWRRMVVANKWEPGEISQQGVPENIYYGGAKIWGQKTSDGLYALVYNPVLNTTWRHPLSVTTSKDGLNFNTYFLNVHSETPLMRYGGGNKDGGGAQYIRGIIPGNGNPPDGAMWLTYSSNKEDVFVTRVPIPITGIVKKNVSDNFDNMETGGIVTDWNIYTGVWNSLGIIKENGNSILRFQDKDPYDYAKAVRVFPETRNAEISFRLRSNRAKEGLLEIEVLNYKGQRPVRIVIDGNNGFIMSNIGEEMVKIGTYKEDEWLDFKININTVLNYYSLIINNKSVVDKKAFAETLSNKDNPYNSEYDTPTIERIEFRTGKYRMMDFSRYGYGANDFLKNEPDLPEPDEALENAVFDLDDFKAVSRK
ncbi:MAG TPA: PA14 domain-containing protein [Bacteroidales bacterium]|nr:PA14 domain-containing protein [Bacteroidales bacterium]